MPVFEIYWEGTVTGVSYVKGKSLKDALQRAKSGESLKDDEESIDIEFYPEDWKVDEPLTRDVVKIQKRALKHTYELKDWLE